MANWGDSEVQDVLLQAEGKVNHHFSGKVNVVTQTLTHLKIWIQYADSLWVIALWHGSACSGCKSKSSGSLLEGVSLLQYCWISVFRWLQRKAAGMGVECGGLERRGSRVLWVSKRRWREFMRGSESWPKFSSPEESPSYDSGSLLLSNTYSDTHKCTPSPQNICTLHLHVPWPLTVLSHNQANLLQNINVKLGEITAFEQLYEEMLFPPL